MDTFVYRVKSGFRRPSFPAGRIRRNSILCSFCEKVNYLRQSRRGISKVGAIPCMGVRRLDRTRRALMSVPDNVRHRCIRRGPFLLLSAHSSRNTPRASVLRCADSSCYVGFKGTLSGRSDSGGALYACHSQGLARRVEYNPSMFHGVLFRTTAGRF